MYVFSIVRLADHLIGFDHVAAGKRKRDALPEQRMNLVVNDIQRHRGIHRDILGGGVVHRRVFHVADFRRHDLRRSLPPDGILSGHGNRVDIVLDCGGHFQRIRQQGAPLAQRRRGIRIHDRNSEGCANAHAFARGIRSGGFPLVLFWQSVACSRGRCRCVHSLRAIGTKRDNAVYVDVIRQGIG